MKPSQETRDIVLDRDQHRCTLCGASSDGLLQIHHRHPRKMGSTRRSWVNRPANLVTVCHIHHSYLESHRTFAQELGYLIPMGQAVARSVKLRTWRGWAFLGDSGEFIPTTAP